MSDKHSMFSGVAIGLLAGLLIGGVVAILAAPQPGDQTRALIREHASNTVRDTRGRADAVLAEVRTRSQEFAERLRKTNGTKLTAEIVAE